MPSLVQPAIAGPPVFPNSANSGGIMGKDDFLKLLVQQLRYQDPLNPLKGTEFAAQLAQFSSVEQLSNIKSSLMQSIDANFVLTQSINNALAATFIGKDVRAATSTFGYSGTGEVKLGYNLGLAATNIKITIKNERGDVVRTITTTPKEKGDNTFVWDGQIGEEPNLTQAASGKYTFEVEAKDSNGATIESNQFIFGTVTAVRYKAEGTVFVINGQEVSLSSILEILQG